MESLYVSKMIRSDLPKYIVPSDDLFRALHAHNHFLQHRRIIRSLLSNGNPLPELSSPHRPTSSSALPPPLLLPLNVSPPVFIPFAGCTAPTSRLRAACLHISRLNSLLFSDTKSFKIRRRTARRSCATARRRASNANCWKCER